MQDSRWLPATEIRLDPRTEGLKLLRGGTLTPETCGNAAHSRTTHQKDQELGGLPLGRHRLEFDAEIEIGRTGQIWSGVLAFDVEVVESLAQAVQPVSTPAIDDAIRRAIGVCTSPWGQDQEPAVLVVLDADTSKNRELATLAVSSRVEFRKNGITQQSVVMIVHRYDQLLCENSVYDGDIKLFSFEQLTAYPVERLEDLAELANWSIRITGTDKNVLKLWHATHR